MTMIETTIVDREERTSTHIKEKVILCFRCHGHGTYQTGMCDMIYTGDDPVFHQAGDACEVCTGTGRLLKKTVITCEPFVAD